MSEGLASFRARDNLFTNLVGRQLAGQKIKDLARQSVRQAHTFSAKLLVNCQQIVSSPTRHAEPSVYPAFEAALVGPRDGPGRPAAALAMDRPVAGEKAASATRL